MEHIKFEHWLRDQKDREDSIGDLAKYFVASKAPSIEDTFGKYKPCEEIEYKYMEAKMEYYKYKMEYYIYMRQQLEKLFREIAKNEDV